MVELSRRRFLLASAGAGAAGLLVGTAAVTWPDLLDAARRRPLADGSGILVLVTLYGGNDGVNTVVPYADSAYYSARPELAYDATEVLRLDDQLGLNPGLKGMYDLWQAQKLAVVRGVGYPKPDRSHFRSMDIWQTASPSEPVGTGWIGRWLDATGDDPLRAVNIGAVLPPLMVGEKNTAAALIVGDDTGHPYKDTIAALGADDRDDTPAMSTVRASYRAAQIADSALQPQPADAAGAVVADDGYDNPLGDQLDMVARAVSADVPTRVYTVSLGGFDTHADERDTQQQLLSTFDTAVGEFLQRMAQDRNGRNVVLMAYSEFGRRLAANASLGTDHGTAGPVFIAGAPVRGGFYGDEPSLTDLDDGDLKVTTDFRDVYSEVLMYGLGTDAEPIVGAGRRQLGFL